MSKKQTLLWGMMLILSLFNTLSAQTIDIHLSRHPYRKLAVMLKNGVIRDTIYDGEMDDKGKVRIVIPDSYRGYKGMATIGMGGRNYLDFIVAGEDFSITCKHDLPYGGNVEFSNSVENESLQKWFYEQNMRLRKIDIVREALRMYAEEESLYASLSIEKQRLEEQQQKFEQMLSQSNLYAAKFIRLRNFLDAKVGNLFSANEKEMISVRNYVRDALDINSLYTSGMWYDMLNNLLSIYEKDAPFYGDFMKDMGILLSRANNDRIYLALAEDLFSICQSMGWNNHEEELASYLINGRHISEPTGKIKLLFSLFKLSKGVRAPQLTQGILPKKKTILAFYDSGCGSCTTQMNKLTELYPELQKLGYEVISLSSDVDKALFEGYAKKLPWNSKYCDLKGFSGKDFSTYGIIGTPTFYLLDEKGIVLGRYARVEDIKMYDK